MKIKLLRRDIETAAVDFYGGGGRNCAVALAVKRAFPGERVCVSEREVSVGGVSLALPVRVGRFINEFDHNWNRPNWRKSVKLVSFSLDVD